MVNADMCEHDWPGSGCPECRAERNRRKADAALAKPASEPASGGALRAVHEFDVREYVDEYEFRGDEGDYQPTERERVLLEDAIAGAVGAIAETIAALSSSPAEAEALPAGVDAGRELAPGLVAVFYRDGVLEGDQAAAASEFLEGVVKGLFARLSASAPAPEERAVPAEAEAKEGRADG